MDGFRSGKVVEDSFGASRYAGDFRGKKQIEVTGERKFRNKLLSVRFSTLDKTTFPQGGSTCSSTSASGPTPLLRNGTSPFEGVRHRRGG